MSSRAESVVDAAGGYFGLDLPAAPGPSPLDGALRFQSCRAAFLALLQHARPSAVHLPWFLCDSLAEALGQAGVAVCRYALDEHFRPAAPVELASGEWLLAVNYFGLCGAQTQEMAAMHGPERTVLDHAQALYALPGDGLATLVSPRKFLGVPDGGALWTTLPVARPEEVDTRSLQRATGLLQRTAFDAEAGFASYQAAERSLSGLAPRQMSLLTGRLLGAVDHDRVRATRRRNFELLHSALAPHNRLCWTLAPDAVPLCYPFWPHRPLERALLHRQRLYVPCYWPGLLAPGSAAPALERQWAQQLLPLPVDQRLDEAALERQVLAPLRALLST